MPAKESKPQPRATLRGCFAEMFTYLAIFLVLIFSLFLSCGCGCERMRFGPDY